MGRAPHPLKNDAIDYIKANPDKFTGKVTDQIDILRKHFKNKNLPQAITIRAWVDEAHGKTRPSKSSQAPTAPKQKKARQTQSSSAKEKRTTGRRRSQQSNPSLHDSMYAAAINLIKNKQQELDSLIKEVMQTLNVDEKQIMKDIRG